MRFPRANRSRSQVPIVPMIDILFILLVYVIVTTQPKKPRDVLKIELPTVKELASSTIQDERSVLAIDAAGNITLDALAIPEGLLESYLIAFQKQNPGRKLELQADRLLALERLLGVWESLSNAGIEVSEVPARIHLPTETP